LDEVSKQGAGVTNRITAMSDDSDRLLSDAWLAREKKVSSRRVARFRVTNPITYLLEQ
jgi:hypothetical protein